MVRGCLVNVIYRKTTEVNAVALDDAAAVTLMNTDVERIVAGLALMHQVWSTLLQIVISLYLLYGMVGAAFVVPLLLFLCMFPLLSFFSFFIKPAFPSSY